MSTTGITCHQLLYACFLTVFACAGYCLSWSTNYNALTQYLTHYYRMQASSLVYFHKVFLGLPPCSHASQKNCRQSRYSLCSQGLLLLLVPKVCTELGNTVFMYPAPSSRNALQKDFNLVRLVSLNLFRSSNQVVISSSGCHFN